MRPSVPTTGKVLGGSYVTRVLVCFQEAPPQGVLVRGHADPVQGYLIYKKKDPPLRPYRRPLLRVLVGS